MRPKQVLTKQTYLANLKGNHGMNERIGTIERRAFYTLIILKAS